MSLETSDLLQSAVLWTITGFDREGQAILSTPVQICCRRLRDKRQARTGNTTSNASVARLAVDREIAMDSEVWIGKLADLPTTLTNVYKVIDYHEVPDIKAREVRRIVSLERKF